MSEQHNVIRTSRNEKGFVLTGGQFALGFMTCFVTLLLLYLAFFDETGFIENSLEISTILVALSSVFIAFVALREQRLIRQAGTDPVILAHISERDDTRQMTMFCLSNVGAGAALEVAIKVQPPANGFDKKRVITPFEELSYPIKVILQGKSVCYNFGVSHRLLDGSDTVPPFSVDISYKDVDGSQYKSRQSIDVRELRYQPAHDLPTMRIVKELEGIKKQLGAMQRKES
jgi:hypothetical protein